MRRCIYCLEEKNEDAFNREHVLQEAFGTYEGNLVLTCVCRECNDRFSKDLDLKLSRDTLEGFERYRSNLKDPSEFKHIGTRSTTRIEALEGPMQGVIFWAKPHHEGATLSDEDIPPQFGLAKQPEGPFKYYLLDPLPTKDELRAQGFEPGNPLALRVWGAEFDEVWRKLEEALGFHGGERLPDTRAGQGRTAAELIFRVSHPEFRAVTKIAMNYLAAVTSPGIAALPHFNAARRYVTHGIQPQKSLILAVTSAGIVRNQASGLPAMGHILSVDTMGDRVVAQVSLSSQVRYVVLLSDTPFALAVTLRRAHFFEPAAHRIAEIAPPPLG